MSDQRDAVPGTWPRDPGPGERRWRLVRISAHLHNDLPDYVALADALRGLLGRATNR